MKKERKSKHFVQKPTYKGGLKAMRQFLKENMQYPEAAMEAQVSGTVSVKYSIDHRGRVVAARVVSGLGHGCDEEAIRLVKLLKFEVPRSRKVKVLFHKNLQVHFRPPKKAPAPPQPTPSTTQVTYSYTTSKGEPAKPPSKESTGGGYHYTIQL